MYSTSYTHKNLTNKLYSNLLTEYKRKKQKL